CCAPAFSSLPRPPSLPLFPYTTLFRSVILKTAGGWFEDDSRGGRFDVLALRGDMVAFLLQRLAQLLERLGLEHDAVAPAAAAGKIGRAHVWTPVTDPSPMPSSAFRKNT